MKMTYTKKINKIQYGLLSFLVAGALLFLGPISALAQNNPHTGAVTISGDMVVGQTLTTSSSLADEDGLGELSYQWLTAGGIKAWGGYGSSGYPTDNVYTQIFSTEQAYAAMKADGSITAWGGGHAGGTGGPTDNGYTQIYSTSYAFAAMKADGSITAWGNASHGSTGAPTDNGYTKIFSGDWAFAALKADGSITAWGHVDYGGSGAPTDNGYTQIYSTPGAFAVM